MYTFKKLNYKGVFLESVQKYSELRKLNKLIFKVCFFKSKIVIKNLFIQMLLNDTKICKHHIKVCKLMHKYEKSNKTYSFLQKRNNLNHNTHFFYQVVPLVSERG